VELTTEQKQAAIVDLGSREGPAREVAEKYGVSRVALYRWKNELLGKERPVTKHKRRKSIDSDDKDVLLAKVESLKEQVKALEKQVYRLRLEKDVLEVTAELLKKARAPIPRN
jgi:transposase-like protein